ncbi:MAG: hypothetical protein L0221_13145 [Chloroflexi bacterium]|nr:hypothetical protein [Chloroflexota bacterium]
MTTPSAPNATGGPATPAQHGGPAATQLAPEQTHPCVRCGKPVPFHVALCEECNPLGLSDPAASQAHGIAVIGIVVFVVFLAVVARVSLAGLGPFTAAVIDAVPSGDGLTVTIQVSNAGTQAGQTNCVLRDPSSAVAGPVVRVQTPIVPAGGSATFRRDVSFFGNVPLALAVTCTSP